MLRTLIAAALLVTTTATSAGAQQVVTEIPNTVAGRILREWLQAVNTADDTGIRSYAVRYEAENPGDPNLVEETLRNIRAVRERTGGVTVQSIDGVAETAIELTLNTRRGPRLSMRMDVALANGNFRVMQIKLDPVAHTGP